MNRRGFRRESGGRGQRERFGAGAGAGAGANGNGTAILGAPGVRRSAAGLAWLFLLACVGAGVSGGAPRERAVAAPPPVDASADLFDSIVIDPGHGGDDHGARGAQGLLEKELVLDVSKRVAAQLRKHGLRVLLTRDGDSTVGLEARTSVANDARADLFLSIHANAARARGARGTETYFAALEASDESARKAAELENQAFGAAANPAARSRDPLVAIFGDLIATEHLRDAQDFAQLAQGRLQEVDLARSRGVKQAPFVVLMGVQMPAALVEIGFISNPSEEKALRSAKRRDAIAEALTRAVLEFKGRYDARRGVQSRTTTGGR